MGKRLDAIASRHQPTNTFQLARADAPTRLVAGCWQCNQPWPCDAAVLLMHIARREQVQEPGTERADG